MKLKRFALWAFAASILVVCGSLWASQSEAAANGGPLSSYFTSLNRPFDSYLEIEEVSPSWAEAKYLSEKPGQLEDDIYAFKPKNTRLAFFYSMLIPGAGEFYAGSKIKPLLFLGLEASLWSGYFVYHGKGNDKEDEFKAYGDLHYNREPYDIWWNSLDSTEQNAFSHRLPDEKNHEYYENIGKYDQFAIGWEDIDIEPQDFNPRDSVRPSGLRNAYLDTRDESNRMFSRARTFTVCVLVNHVLSGFDAALTARSYNKKQERFAGLQLKMKMREYQNESIPQLTLTKSFY